ncbi:MAG: hypothetical protein MJ070_05990 [Lachnospiraceae bacterium]|nr:hypothetical protein [Lachnospiraceae bacterium]
MADKKKNEEPSAKERYLNARSAAEGALSGLSERQPFSYDPDGDALYRQYRDRYVELGRGAMEDTVGRASALTGGYSNSYAVGAGNQAYANYLKELNELVPELEARAYSRWKDGNEEERKLYGLLSDAADLAYSRYRDEIADGRYADETAYKRSRDAISDARYADETAYKRSRDEADDAYRALRDLYEDRRAAYEYENDLNYKYDGILASKGYDLRTEEGRAAARDSSGSVPQSTGPAPDAVPAKADTVIARLASYLDNGQTESASRLIAAYRAMGYTGWADLMTGIYLTEASGGQQSGKESSGEKEPSDKPGTEKEAGWTRPDGTERTRVPVETAEERGNDRFPVGLTALPSLAGAIAGAGDFGKKDDKEQNAEPGAGLGAVAALLDAFEAIKNAEKAVRKG